MLIKYPSIGDAATVDSFEVFSFKNVKASISLLENTSKFDAETIEGMTDVNSVNNKTNRINNNLDLCSFVFET